MTSDTGHAVINRLIETCRDGERGYRQAATEVESPELQQLFGKLADQRALFANELLPHAQRLGGDQPRPGTPAAALHRALMALEATLGAGDTTITREVRRGDNETLRVYTEAIQSALPPQSRTLIERQLDELEETHLGLPASRRVR